MAQGKAKGQRLGKGLLGPTPKALRPVKTKRLQKQATRLMRKTYKPALKELDAQGKKVESIAAKRAQDNNLYNQWLATQTGQLNAHAAAADAQLAAQGSAIQQEASQAALELRDKLVEQGASNAGNVSNSAQASAFDVSAEGQRAQSAVAAERMRSAALVGTRQEAAGTMNASNFALAASNEARRQSDLYQGLREVAGAKQKVVLERAAATSEEVARLLDREVTKAQAQVDMRQIAAQLAIDLKNFRLNKKNYKLDRQIRTGELALAQRAQAEEERANRAAEQDADKDRKLSKQEQKQEQNQNQQEQNQEQKEQQRQIKHAINNTISEVAARPKWQRIGSKNPNELIKLLSQHGVESVFARAAVDLMFRGGELSMGSKRNLRQMGFDIPKNWK